MLYRFGPFLLDPSRHGLYRDEDLVPLEPRAYDVLVYLVQHRDRLITYDELMEQVWDESFVDTSVVSRSVSVLRRVLGDDRRRQQVIQTRWGQGYQFVAEVATIDTSTPDVPAVAIPSSPPPPAIPPPTVSPRGQRCPACQAVQTAPGRFCTTCGAPLEALCVACGSPLPAQAVFCAVCGQRQDVSVSATPALHGPLAGDDTQATVPPAAPAAVQADRRPLSVVCAVWDKALVLHWDLDDLPERLAGLQRWVEQTVGAFGGTLLALQRTSLLLGFGVPLVQEAHALRALAAAITLRNQSARLPLGGPVPLDTGQHLRLAVGSGLVVVTAPETFAGQTPQVLGEVQAEVQRLAEQAAPGTLVVTAALARLIHPMIPLEPPYPAVDAAASQVYRVDTTEVPELLSRPERPARLAGVFVGRDTELASLHGQCDQVQQGRGQLLGIVGEAGLGKSRLLREFRHSLRDEPVTYLAGGCLPYGASTLYEPFLRLVRQCCQFPDRAAAPQMRQAIDASLQLLGLEPSEWGPYLASLLDLPDDAPVLRGISPQVLQLRQFEVMHQVFLHRAAQQPLILEVENLHWISATPEAYLRSLAGRIADAPILVLLSYRPEYQPEWFQSAQVAQVVLRPLLPEDSARVVQAHHQETLADATVDLILRRAQGNPLFLEELTQALEQTDRQAAALPPTIQAVLSARLGRLASDARWVLQVAAVIGAEVPEALLRSLLPLADTELDAHLIALQQLGFLDRIQVLPEIVYTFHHALIREAAYDTLLRPERQALHAQIAQALEVKYAEMIDTHPERLAHHYTAAGLAQAAVDYWLRAGQRALERSAYQEAMDHLGRGHQVLDELPATPQRMQRKLALLMALGRAYYALYGQGAAEVEEVFTQAIALCEVLGDTGQQVTALQGLCGFYTMRGDFNMAQELCDQLVQLAQHSPDPAQSSSAMQRQGSIAFYRGEFAVARRALEPDMTQTAPSASSFISSINLEARRLSMLAMVLCLQGYPDQALAHGNAALALVNASDHPFGAALAHSWYGALHFYLRNLATSLSHFSTMRELAHSYHFAESQGRADLDCRAIAAVAAPDESDLQALHRDIDRFRQGNVGLNLSRLLYLLAEGYRIQHQPEAGLQVVQAAIERIGRSHERFWEAELYRLQGLLYLVQAGDQADRAETSFQHALSIARRQQAKSLELRAAMSLARLGQQQGKPQQAYDLLAPVYAWFTEGFDTLDLQDAKALLGDLSSHLS